MDEIHQVLLDATHHNTRLLEKQSNRLDMLEKDVVKLKYYIYTLAGIVVLMLGKPEWLAVLL